MSDFHSDLRKLPFGTSPASSVALLYDQYMHDLSQILDKHAPLVSAVAGSSGLIGYLTLTDVQSLLDVSMNVPGKNTKVIPT